MVKLVLSSLLSIEFRVAFDLLSTRKTCVQFMPELERFPVGELVAQKYLSVALPRRKIDQAASNILNEDSGIKNGLNEGLKYFLPILRGDSGNQFGDAAPRLRRPVAVAISVGMTR